MSLWNKFWRDKDGNVVIWQTPNLPLVTWFVMMISAKLISNSYLQGLAQAISVVAILIWAVLELLYGASYFRRVLGLVVLGFVVRSLLAGI